VTAASAVPFAALSGVPISKLHLVVPATGIWHADVSLVTATDVAGPQILLLSGSTWNCAVLRAVDFAGTRELRLVGGTGGWRQTVPALEYQSPAGVPTATLLADAAALVQEAPPVLDPTVAATVGTYYVRQRGAASLLLWDLVGAAVLTTWWVDPTGIVQTAPRSAAPVLSPFVAEQARGAAGWYRIGTESPGDWTPGRSFAGPTVSGSISRVEHRLSRGRFWTEVLAP
jgi:hypothetical protein